MPLPPQVSGPLTVASKGVWVSGVLDGAQIQLRSNGADLGGSVASTGPSTFVEVAASALVAGATITATQTLNGVPSEPSPYGPIVAGLPDMATGLPAPVYLSGLHTLVDWVRLGGLFPGATVEVRHRGQLIGSIVAGSNSESVPVRFNPLPNPGDSLEAVQFVTAGAGNVLRSPATPSLPLAGWGREKPLPAPTVASPFECDLAVLVSGLADGVSLVVNHGPDVLEGYPFVGAPVWASLRRQAIPQDTFTALQKLDQAGIVSPVSTPTTSVSSEPELPTPQLIGPVCPDAQEVRIRELRPGATVAVYGERKTSTGGGAGALIGQFRAWAPDCTVPLTQHWALIDQLQQPGELYLQASQQNCTKGSKTGEVVVQPLFGAVGKPVLMQPVGCAGWVLAQQLTPGTVVEVLSNEPGWPQLMCPPIAVTSTNMTLYVNRPLRPNEKVHVRQTGCNAAADSDEVLVAPFGGVGKPKVRDPVRIPHGGAWIDGLVVGARVHVYVNEVLQTSVDAVAGSIFVQLNGLARESRVTARQTMCDRLSDTSNTVLATLGELVLFISPDPIVRGQPTTVRVDAVDRETKQPVAGTVAIGPATVGMTGQGFAHTFGPGQPPPTGVVATNYQFAPINWHLVDPAPAKAPRLLLSIVNHSGGQFAIDKVHWDAYLQTGGAVQLVGSAEPSASAVITLTPQQLGQIHLIATVMVHDIEGVGTVADFVGNNPSPGINGQSTFVRAVGNADVALTFELVNVLNYVTGGGGTIAIPTATVRYLSG